MEKIKLEFPIMHDGKKLRELTYDAKAITSGQYIEACSLAMADSKKKNLTISFIENDYALHFYLGCMAIIAVNPELEIVELKQVKGQDILKISNIGLTFTVRRPEDSEEKTSEEPSENTPEPTTPA